MERIPIAQRSARVERVLVEHAGEQAGVLAAPLTMLLGANTYFRELGKQVESIARDGSVHWSARRVAALMLETILSRIGAEEVRERRYWVRRLGLTDPAELERQGYLPGEPLESQLWRRIARLGRIHRLTLAVRASERALCDYIIAARAECRLTLARSLFTPAEVIARMEHDMRRSTGMRDPGRYGHFAEEAARAIERLPELERTIVQHLGRDGIVRWTNLCTTSRINALVEQPVGTVVLTLKPPGSTHEVEIKRAGLIRNLPLCVIWENNGYILPSTHHLDGGSMHHLLTFEAENSAFFSHLFRQVHGHDASMSRTLYMATVRYICTPDGEVDLIDYFTNPAVFGPQYKAIRWNMREVVKTLAGYDNEPFEEPLNDVHLTGMFLGRTKPAQAVQIGTTMFRLATVEKYLAPSGAERYFRSLKIPWGPDDARRFADELFDEILGQYEPPRVTWRSHQQYVASAFRVPANRAAADAAYLGAMTQLGRFWGTLLGARGHTQGESFVERNAGLRSVWRDGKWQVDLVFMDHDSMSFPGVGARVYRPRDSVANAAKDCKHVLGGVYGQTRVRVRGEHWFLRHIYRANQALEERGVAAFRAEMKRAYDLTHETMRTHPALAKHFKPEFLENLRDWDHLVRTYLQTPHIRSARNAWREASRAYLIAKGYNKEFAEEHVKTVSVHAKFLRRVGFLF